MKKRTIVATVIAIAALSWGTAASAQAQTPWPPASEVIPAPAVREYQGIRYLTGGVSEEERADILAQTRDFNLKVTLAEKSGDYLSDVGLVVTAGNGRKVLETTTDGPMLFAKLPPGQYRVTATANGREQTQTASVSASGQRALSFYW